METFVVQFSGVRELIFGKRSHEYGGVAQLGEHLPCKQGVKGSIPFISTRNPKGFTSSLFTFHSSLLANERERDAGKTEMDELNKPNEKKPVCSSGG